MAYLCSLEDFRKYPMPYYPPLVLCEWSRKHTEEGHSLRALWTEAEFLVLNKLRAGHHPELLEVVIREQLRRPLGSYYRQSYLLNALRVLNNLYSKNAFAKLPNLREFVELRRDLSLSSRYILDMKQRFGDFEELHAMAIDGAIEARLVTFKEFDSEANELLLSMEGEARQWHEDDSIANHRLIRLNPDRVQKDIQYEELSKSWGEERTTSSWERVQYYPPQRLARTATVRRDRDMFKTPSFPRRAKPGPAEHDRAEHNRAVVDPDATIVPIWHDCEPFPGKDREDDRDEGDGDPFYEKYDHPPSLPQGSEPEEYLLSFGFPPPPLLLEKRNNHPPRAPSPSDFGEPLI